MRPEHVTAECKNYKLKRLLWSLWIEKKSEASEEFGVFLLGLLLLVKLLYSGIFFEGLINFELSSYGELVPFVLFSL